MTPIHSINPATGAVFWQGEAADAAAVDRAMRAARAAWPEWALLSFEARCGYVERFRARVEARKDELAVLISQEMGKPLWDSQGEVAAVLGKIAISIKSYAERTGEHFSASGEIRQELRHRPHGVMVVFGPYNFPAHLPNGHIVPALLAGNCVVFKPSEETPAVGAWMVARWQEAGVPEGVLQLVQGGRDVGMALTAHPELNGVLFTGSYATGSAIHRHFAGRPDVLLALEMGGNNPLIVWEAADVEAAALLILHSSFLSSGQRCTCARRLILPAGGEGDALLAALVAKMKHIRVGAYDETPQPFMGPLVNASQAELLLKAQDSLMKSGGKVIMEMARLREGLPFLSPGIMEVTDVVSRSDEELFGPFLQVIRVPNFCAALQEANATAYGLAAGLISDSETLWKEFSATIRAGVVNWNRPTTGASSALPFGGVGRSGNLRPAAYYAADYCAYPMATLAADSVMAPQPVPGVE